MMTSHEDAQGRLPEKKVEDVLSRRHRDMETGRKEFGDRDKLRDRKTTWVIIKKSHGDRMKLG